MDNFFLKLKRQERTKGNDRKNWKKINHKDNRNNKK